MSNISIVKRLSVAVFFLLSMAQQLDAQEFVRRNSPYSRFGVGDLQPPTFVPLQGMANALNSTYQSYTTSNFGNPASLASLRFATFEMGVFYKGSLLQEGDDSQIAHDGGLSYLALAFPINRGWQIESDSLRKGIPVQWSMGFRLQPFSRVGYDVRFETELDDIGAVEYGYDGYGNLYEVDWNNGLKYKGLSFGLSTSLLFGQIENTSSINFLDPNYNNGFDESRRNETQVGGFRWKLGAQYEWTLKEPEDEVLENIGGLDLVVGLHGRGRQNINITSSQRYERANIIYGIDTLRNTEEQPGSWSLPSSFGFGLALRSQNQWQFGVDYERQNWAEFESSATNINLASTNRFALGGEWTPNLQSTKFANRIQYRAGLFYQNDPRLIDEAGTDLQLQQYGITFGLGIPLRIDRRLQKFAFLHVALEYGQLGHPELIREEYFKVRLGVSLNDGLWFRPSKFE